MEINLLAAGQRIKEIRKQHNYTMLQFAKMLGFSSPSTVNNWEKGNNLPIENRLKKIALLGNTTVNWIKYGEFKEYVLALLVDTSPESIKISNNPYLLNQLLHSLGEEGLSYNDDLQILTIAKNVCPEVFNKNNFQNEPLVSEEYLNYSVENNRFYRNNLLPKIEELLTNPDTDKFNTRMLLTILDLLNNARQKDADYLKIFHNLLECFTFIIYDCDALIDAESNENTNRDAEQAKSDYLKRKNELISLLDMFHIHYHF